MLYSLFWVIPRSLNFMSWRFGTLFHPWNREFLNVGVWNSDAGESPKRKYTRSITYSECVFVALFIQNAMLMPQTVICSLSVLWIFPPPHYLMKGTIFEKKKFIDPQNVFWFSLQLLSETFLILRIVERDRIKRIYWSSWQVLVILTGF